MQVQTVTARRPPRVLVADDTAIGAALESRLERDPELACVGRVVEVGRVAPEALRQRADVVLLGHLLGGGASLHVVRELVERLPEVRVLVVSELASDILARESLRRGAAGFLVHSGQVEPLLARIRACIGPTVETVPA